MCLWSEFASFREAAPVFSASVPTTTIRLPQDTRRPTGSSPTLDQGAGQGNEFEPIVLGMHLIDAQRDQSSQLFGGFNRYLWLADFQTAFLLDTVYTT